ncbi:GAF domain-containing protein [Marinitoga aeolica]|uniref:GAF domain-containing protein n=1 Tax=Marinitoga aeolica TaxID=2809031 RepID=A0ABY8PT96_9BACT|nr:GAF domain-containing protein [Marinitoga aeolica]WGS65851.1 GAF domain-containing protein [Marinitoga aeolica]
MNFISTLSFNEFNEYINNIFNDIIKNLNVYSGSLIVFDENNNIIFKIEKNLNIDIDNISPGKIDQMFLKEKKPIIINNEDLEKYNIKKKKNDVISSIIFPMYFKDRLIGIMNLNRKDKKFCETDLDFLFKIKAYILPAIYNIILLEEIHSERERFKNYAYIFELIVDIYSKTNTAIEFMNSVIKTVKNKFGVDVKLISSDTPGKNSLRIKDKYYKIYIDYNTDEEIVEKIKDFFMKIVIIKHSEELNKILENYSELAKETLLMNFISWDLIQEINSALTGLNLIMFFFESQHPKIANELKKSINRIKEAIIKYKSNFYNDESIELVSINDIIKEIEKKIVFLNPDIKFFNHIEVKALIFASRNILYNIILNIIVSILKYTNNKRFDVYLIKEKGFYILRIETNIIRSEMNNKDLKNSLKISSTMLSNYHIEFYYSSNENGTEFVLQIPSKSD